MNKRYPHIFSTKRNGDILFIIYKNDTKQQSHHLYNGENNVEIKSFLKFEVKFDNFISNLFLKIINCKDEI